MGPLDLDVAVIGAGIAGLSCARRLDALGASVVVFEEADTPGGRVSTRREEGWSVDTGAQFFIARTPPFQAITRYLINEGVVAKWDGRIRTLEAGRLGSPKEEVERYVGIPGMDALPEAIAKGLDVRYRKKLAACIHDGKRWRLETEEGGKQGPFDFVVAAVPPSRAISLFAGTTAGFRGALKDVEMIPCHAVVARLDQPLPLEFDGALVSSSPLRWVARNNSKPGREEVETWVLHGSPEWSQAHAAVEDESAAKSLWGAFREAVGRSLPEPADLEIRFWPTANTSRPMGYDSTTLVQPYLMDYLDRAALCGDWCVGAGIEGAYFSGEMLAFKIWNDLGTRVDPDPSGFNA